MTRRDVDALWGRFTAVTRARIGLGRSGDAIPTRHLLDFQYAHASARDAVGAAVDFAALAGELEPMPSVQVRSAARDRPDFLRRPDLGRILAAGCSAELPPGPYDAVFVIADGLSATAVHAHAARTLSEVVARLPGWSFGPVVLALQARVALGDEIGALMHATMVVVLIGERPGLTVPNSLGAYLTYGPRTGRRDSERNCVSNIHADGLPYALAADKLAWLMMQARTLRLTGVALKEDAHRLPAPADTAALAASAAPAAPMPKALDSKPP